MLLREWRNLRIIAKARLRSFVDAGQVIFRSFYYVSRGFLYNRRLMSRLKSVENEFKGIKQELSQKRKRKHTMSGALRKSSMMER